MKFKPLFSIQLLKLIIIFTAMSPMVHAQKNWTLIWSDEFNKAKGTSVDETKWIYDLGTSYCPDCPPNWGTGEIEINTKSTANVYHDGRGHLAIKPIKSGDTWTSGRIETKRTDFQPGAYGVMAVEASIQLPDVGPHEGKGYWPLFWMMGDAYRGNYRNTPETGEIDILENVKGQNIVHGTFHCGTLEDGPCFESTGLGGTMLGFAPSLQKGFHKFRMELDRSLTPQQIRFYVDNVNYLSLSANKVDAKTWNDATNHGFFMILNVAIGGWGGMPNHETRSGKPMLIDYVRVYYR
ncbi:MAG: family 16 glycosylhydrolase [Tatlockia sp.]|nr:family 16 glycosylhydrolase [Tatlockia sp.]